MNKKFNFKSEKYDDAWVNGIRLGNEQNCIDEIISVINDEEIEEVLADYICETASNAVDSKVELLFKHCVGTNDCFVPYIDRALQEYFKKDNDFYDVLMAAQNLYYCDYLDKNIDIIVKNALIKYISGFVFEIECSEAEIDDKINELEKLTGSVINLFEFKDCGFTNEIRLKFMSEITEMLNTYMNDNDKIKIEMRKDD